MAKRRTRRYNRNKYSKIKGKNFESYIADTIHNIAYYKLVDYAEWVTRNPELRVRKNASSGSQKDAFGDIDLGYLRHLLPLYIEVKKRKNWPYTSLFKDPDKCPMVRIFYETSLKAQKKDNLYPVFIFGANYKPTLVICYYSVPFLDNKPVYSIVEPGTPILNMGHICCLEFKTFFTGLIEHVAVKE